MRLIAGIIPTENCFRHVQRDVERIYADLALLIAEHDVYIIDSQPLHKGLRYTRNRHLSETDSGRGGATKQFYGFKLNAVCTGTGAICRFGIASASEKAKKR